MSKLAEARHHKELITDITTTRRIEKKLELSGIYRIFEMVPVDAPDYPNKRYLVAGFSPGRTDRFFIVDANLETQFELKGV